MSEEKQNKQKEQVEQKKKGKKKSWNRGGRDRKNKMTAREQRIGALLDQADEQELLKISAVHSRVTMPLPNQEKLAWSVIDRADLLDEEERERRRVFQKMLRRKRILRAVAVCGVLVLLLAVLAFCGVFDRINPPHYKNYYFAGGGCFGGEQPAAALQENILPWRAKIEIPSLESEPYVDEDKLDTTVYYILAEYCEANGYAVDEYEIPEEGREYQLIDGKLYLRCTVLAQCLDYQVSDQGKTWQDRGYTDAEKARQSTEDFIHASSDLSIHYPADINQPVNMYTLGLKLCICI